MKKAECRNFVINRTWDKKKKSQEFASSLLSLLNATHAREALYALVLPTWSSSFVKHIIYCPYMYVCMYICIVCLFAAHDSKKPVQVAYIPGHLYHMLFELMKVRHKFRPCLAAGTVHCSNAVH